MLAFLHRLWTDEEGQGMVEYGLIIALIAIVVMVALEAMGGSISAIFGNISSALTQP